MSQNTILNRRKVLKTTPVLFGLSAGCTGGQQETTPTSTPQQTQEPTQTQEEHTPTPKEQTQTSTPTYDEVVSSLREKAEQEGEVFFRGTTHLTIESTLAEYVEQNTGITPQTSGGGINKNIAQSVTEMEVGKLKADIISPTHPQQQLLAMEEDAMMSDIMPPAVTYDKAPEGFNPGWDSENRWMTGALFPSALCYNTDLVSADEVPKTFDEMLDPKWENSFFVHKDNSGLRTMTRIMHVKGSWDAAVEYMKEFRPQIKRLQTSAFTSVFEVGQGQAKFFTGAPLNLVKQIGSERDLPLDFVFPDDFVAFGERTFGIFRGAPNPNAAKFVFELMTRNDVQQAFLEKNYYESVNSDLWSDKIKETVSRGESVFINPPFSIELSQQTGLSASERLEQYRSLIGSA